MTPADFRQFIESQRPEGCQTPIHVLRHMVNGTPVADTVEGLLRGKSGNDVSSRDASGRFSKPSPCDGLGNSQSLMPRDASAPVVIPMPKAEKPKRVRDYSRESKQGNSVGYTLRRLEREAPELLTRVKDGEMSPNAAAIKDLGLLANNYMFVEGLSRLTSPLSSSARPLCHARRRARALRAADSQPYRQRPPRLG